MNSLIENIITSIQSNIVFASVALGILIIIYTISLAVIFKKIGHKARYAFIPIYNIMSLLAILNIPQWMVLVMFIPFVNILGLPIMIFIIGYKLGSVCRKNLFMKIGLMILSPIFYPLLAFTDIDVDGSRLKNYQPVKKAEFKLEPVEIANVIEAPTAMSLADSSTLDKITTKKIKSYVAKKDSNLDNAINQKTIAEQLAKADKENPTANDLTFDYNILYNSKETKLNNVKEVLPKVEEKIKPVESKQEKIEEEIEEDVDDTPIVPIFHDVVLDEAKPINVADIGPVPINQQYENQMVANKKQLEKKRELEKELAEKKKLDEELVKAVEPIAIIDNGPVNIDSSLAGLMAAAPEFNTNRTVAPKKEIELKEEPTVVVEKGPTTEVQEIVSMKIVEPTQLPVGVLPKDNIEETPQEELKVPEEKKEEPNILQDQNGGPLLRPIAQVDAYVQVDKSCPKCGTKVRRDCPICTLCGYKF